MSVMIQEESCAASPENLWSEGAALPMSAVTSAFVGSSADGKGGSTKVKVLVADDEQVIANTLALILNRAGFEARAVYSGRAALDALEGFDLDVLISDVMMPEMTGIEAAIAIVTQRPLCQVVLFSGQAGTADLLQEARAQGHCFEILTKPVHPTVLLAKLGVASVR